MELERLTRGCYMIKKTGLFCGLFALMSVFVLSGIPSVFALGKAIAVKERKGSWRAFDVLNGLPSATIQVIVQDRDGKIWVGAYGGISCYDGEAWITSTKDDGLVDNVVQALEHDSKGNLWIGTRNGVSRFDGSTFTNFTVDDGLVDNDVKTILEDWDGNIWFGTSGGVSRFTPKQQGFTTLPSDTVRAILQDQNGCVWFGTSSGVCQFEDQFVRRFSTDNGLAHNTVFAMHQDRSGIFWFGTGGGISRYDPTANSVASSERGVAWSSGKTSWKTFTTAEGLVHNTVQDITQDLEGKIWFGTRGGVGWYDPLLNSGITGLDQDLQTGRKAVGSLTTRDGLTHNNVQALMQDREGNFWFGTSGGGVNQYSGSIWTRFTLPTDGWILSVMEDRQDNLWFGTSNGGVVRYDGEAFRAFTEEDGLISSNVKPILQSQDSQFWIGTRMGVSRYDGQQFISYTAENGLAEGPVMSLLQDSDAHVWFGSLGGGLSHFDGQKFTTYTTENGLVSNMVSAMVQAQNGGLWFASPGGGLTYFDGQTFSDRSVPGLSGNGMTVVAFDSDDNLWACAYGSGVSRYDGEKWAQFSFEDGFAFGSIVQAVFQDREGHIWFGTDGAGTVRYDGQIFQTLTREDGLGNNTIYSIAQDRNGALWFGGPNGTLTRFQPPASVPPPTVIDAVIGDHRYEKLSEVSMPASFDLVTFEFHGISVKTRPGGLIYRYRLIGYDDIWHTTRKHRAEYPNLPIGDYTFEVYSVDRDLVYSHVPAAVRLDIHLPYTTIVLSTLLGLALVIAGVSTHSAIKRRRDFHRAEQALMHELQDELQTAHELQMSLMPATQPDIEGFDIAGRCIPAAQVGGDFYLYFERKNTLALAVADVTGHAMEAAIPVVLFDGILESHLKLALDLNLDLDLNALFKYLNELMCLKLNKRTFVCFMMGELNPETRMFRVSSGGCPPPYYYCAETGALHELEIDAYPLGININTEYPILDQQLQSGDRLVFCSDGVPETEDVSGEQLGYERTARAIRDACRQKYSAEKTISHILDVARDFQGTAPQSDDITCVVVCVE